MDQVWANTGDAAAGHAKFQARVRTSSRPSLTVVTEKGILAARETTIA